MLPILSLCLQMSPPLAATPTPPLTLLLQRPQVTSGLLGLRAHVTFLILTSVPFDVMDHFLLLETGRPWTLMSPSAGPLPASAFTRNPSPARPQCRQITWPKRIRLNWAHVLAQ